MSVFYSQNQLSEKEKKLEKFNSTLQGAKQKITQLIGKGVHCSRRNRKLHLKSSHLIRKLSIGIGSYAHVKSHVRSTIH